MAQPSYLTIATEFMKYYYGQFDTNRANLVALYGANSMLTYDGEQYLGAEQIATKLATLPKVRHQVTTADVQPTANGMLCFICGDLFVDDSPNSLKFSQVFNIVPSPTGGYYCINFFLVMIRTAKTNE